MLVEGREEETGGDTERALQARDLRKQLVLYLATLTVQAQPFSAPQSGSSNVGEDSVVGPNQGRYFNNLTRGRQLPTVPS